ncbi:MAG: hypothetical protein GY856_05090, partial [bacterium]|nr:hypothetical protein [bacterium]
DPASHQRALELAEGVLERVPTQTAVLTLLMTARGEALAQRARKILSDYLEDFSARRTQIVTEAGSMPRLQAAIIATRHLLKAAKAENRKQQASTLARQLTTDEAALEDLAARVP